jgi:hypothetical protein
MVHPTYYVFCLKFIDIHIYIYLKKGNILSTVSIVSDHERVIETAFVLMQACLSCRNQKEKEAMLDVCTGVLMCI